MFQGNSLSGDHGSYGYDNGLAGMAYEEQSFDSSSVLVSRHLRSWTKKSYFDWPVKADWHPRVIQEESISYDSSGSGVSTTLKYNYEGDLDLRDARAGQQD